jgi:hypothetical protein
VPFPGPNSRPGDKEPPDCPEDDRLGDHDRPPER